MSHRQELAAAVCAEGLRPLTRDDTPPPLLALLEACWHVQPTARPTAAHVAAALDAMLADTPPTSMPPAQAQPGGLASGSQPHCDAQVDHVPEAVNGSVKPPSIPWPSTVYQPKVGDRACLCAPPWSTGQRGHVCHARAARRGQDGGHGGGRQPLGGCQPARAPAGGV